MYDTFQNGKAFLENGRGKSFSFVIKKKKKGDRLRDGFGYKPHWSFHSDIELLRMR